MPLTFHSDSVLAPIIVSVINEDGYYLPFCKIITASRFGLLVKNLPVKQEVWI